MRTIVPVEHFDNVGVIKHSRYCVLIPLWRGEGRDQPNVFDGHPRAFRLIICKPEGKREGKEGKEDKNLCCEDAPVYVLDVFKKVRQFSWSAPQL